MAAGLGFKTFLTGDVLTAADTNGYLMQGVLVFATAAARDSAITSLTARRASLLLKRYRCSYDLFRISMGCGWQYTWFKFN